MGSEERKTMLDRLLEMVRGRDSVATGRPETGERKAKRDQSKIARKASRKRKKAGA
jgi:hypothetical protein